MGEKAALEFWAEGEAAEGAVGGNDAMAGDGEANGIGGNGLADGAGGAGPACFGGELTVRTGLAEGYALQGGPDALLKGGASGHEFEGEGLALAVEEFLNFAPGRGHAMRVANEFAGMAAAGQGGFPAKGGGNDRAAFVDGEGKIAHRGSEGVKAVIHN